MSQNVGDISRDTGEMPQDVRDVTGWGGGGGCHKMRGEMSQDGGRCHRMWERSQKMRGDVTG